MRVIAAEPQAQNLAQRTTELSTTTRIEDTTSQSLQRQANSLAEGQRILRETASSVASSNQQVANSKAEGGKSGEGGLLGLVNVGIQLADRAATIKLSQQERELKKQDALQKQKDAEKEARRQEQLTYAESIANDMVMAQRTNGTINTREGIRQVVNDPMFVDLNAEDRREFERRFQSTIRETESDIYRETERVTSEVNKEKARQVEAKLTYDTSAYVSRLRYTSDPAAQNAIVQEMVENSIVAAENAGLGVAEQLALQTRVYQEAARAVGENQAENMGINQTSEQLSFVTEEVARLETLYANGEIDWATKQNYTNYLFANNPKVKGFTLPTAEGAREEAIKRQSDVATLRKLAKEDYEFNNQPPVLENSVIAESALQIVMDPGLRVKYDSLDTGDNRRVLELADHLERIKKELADPARLKQLAASNEARVKAQSLLQSIQQYRANPSSWGAARDAGLPVPDVSDLAVAKASADYDRANSEYQATAGSIATNLSELGKFGVVFDQSTGQLGMSQAVVDEMNQVRSLAPAGTPSPPGGGSSAGFAGLVAPGFNGAGGASGAAYQPLSTKGGMKGTSGTVKLVAPVKKVWKDHLIDDSPVGSYDFTLEDKSNNTQTAIPSPVAGVVTESRWVQGYGNVVAVYDPATKHEWFMAHLASPAPVKVGQTVIPGQKLAVQGSTGNSTGDHVHLEILEGKYSDGGKRITNRARTQPLVEAYLNRAVSGNWPSVSPNSLGLPPSQSLGTLPTSTSRVKTYATTDASPPPPGAMVLPGGGYILGGVLRLPQVRQTSSAQGKASVGKSQFNNNRPLSMPQTSRYREDYPKKNDPTANYGYSTLAQDSAFARALAATSDRLDIPAQWLADIMAFESTQDGVPHNPRAQNAEGAVGLIQFYPGEGLLEVANDMGVSESEAKRRLLGMTRAQQMPWVEKHLQKTLRYAGKQKYERMDDVFAAIFGGPTLLRQSDAERQSVSDSAISYAAYRERIGSHVGRTYTTTRGSRATHTKHHGNCPTCNNMMKTQGKVIPHQAP